MDIKLIVSGGSKAGQALPITVPKFFIGRADDCHLKPKSELISRYHCVIISEDGYAAVRDMQSKNGVYVNGERVSLEQELKNGDKLVIGPLEFTVQLSVTLKGEKKPKVETVKEAVERTIEVASKPSSESESEMEVADWLMGADDDNDQETQTVNLSKIQEEMEETKQELTDSSSNTVKSRIDEAAKNIEAEKKESVKPAMNSQNAAANLLKNFFKGGR
ncbi:MAG: FHA domain-containing protein [Planctomycetaceae bacterium]|jgi:predicted component of type VI protein secretion system|nr:FHA domain-containing protein [Planctomycetaceae bacterium]